MGDEPYQAQGSGFRSKGLTQQYEVMDNMNSRLQRNSRGPRMLVLEVEMGNDVSRKTQRKESGAVQTFVVSRNNNLLISLPFLGKVHPNQL